jgi:hypothetical protein
MAGAPFPIEQYLVPAAPDPLDGATVEMRPLLQGLPETLTLDGEVTLILALATGLATQWRDADPGALVWSSAAELAPWTPAPATPVGDVARPAFRLYVMLRGSAVAALPLAAGLHRVAADDGNATTGAFLELRILAWEIHAGTLVGGGDLGSWLRLEWRRVGTGTPSFATPPLDPHVAERLQRAFRLESQVGPAPQGAIG